MSKVQAGVPGFTVRSGHLVPKSGLGYLSSWSEYMDDWVRGPVGRVPDIVVRTDSLGGLSGSS